MTAKLHYVDHSVSLWLGDCLEVMRDIDDASVDAVVTDPPYNLSFIPIFNPTPESACATPTELAPTTLATGANVATPAPSMTARCAPAADACGDTTEFPTFRYEAKAPTNERPRHGDIAHPTVKPLDLMRWLVRLVTPPGGTVLEPFAGSGTTAEACILEGFKCIAIEREADYLPLIVQRISKPLQVGLGLDFGGVA
jgi:DNA modification methylase